MGTAGVLDFIVCDDRATLIWLAQLAALELHPSLSLVDRPERPTVIAFDLDPGPPATAVECARVALRVREMFGELELECFAKHSGSKGIQVYVPLNTPVTYERTKPFAHAVAQALERAEPSSSSRARRRSCARARCSSTGARTTTRRRRSPSTRCVVASARGRRPR